MPSSVKNNYEPAGEEVGVQKSMWLPEQIAEFYKSYVDQYDMEIDANAADYPGPFIIGQWVLEYLLKNNSDIEGPLRILDLGCGTGQSGLSFLGSAHRNNNKFELVGIDATPEVCFVFTVFNMHFSYLNCNLKMLAKAEKRGYAATLVHDLESHPYPGHSVPSESFDAIICVGVMDFIRQPSKFLNYIKEFYRNQEKGVLGITLPERHNHSDLSSFSVEEMKTLLQKQGGFTKILKHERFMGYRDSVTGNVQYYHGWLCQP